MMADPATRVAALKAWEQAPAARICHPQEDHLIPLMAAVGAAEQEKATRVYHDINVYGGGWHRAIASDKIKLLQRWI